MKFMTTWSAKPGALREAVKRFLATQAAPPPGVTLLGRWHNTDLSGGFSLIETSDPKASFESAALWADLLDFKTHGVIEDAEAGQIYAKVFGK
jgi:hypothetical protein